MTWPIVALVAVLALFVLGLAWILKVAGAPKIRAIAGRAMLGLRDSPESITPLERDSTRLSFAKETTFGVTPPTRPASRGQYEIDVKVVGFDEVKRQLEELLDAAKKVNAAVAQAHRRDDPPDSTSGYVHETNPPNGPPSTYTYGRECGLEIEPENHGGTEAYTALGPENRVPGHVIWKTGTNAGTESPLDKFDVAGDRRRRDLDEGILIRQRDAGGRLRVKAKATQKRKRRS